MSISDRFKMIETLFLYVKGTTSKKGIRTDKTEAFSYLLYENDWERKVRVFAVFLRT